MLSSSDGPARQSALESLRHAAHRHSMNNSNTHVQLSCSNTHYTKRESRQAVVEVLGPVMHLQAQLHHTSTACAANTNVCTAGHTYICRTARAVHLHQQPWVPFVTPASADAGRRHQASCCQTHRFGFSIVRQRFDQAASALCTSGSSPLHHRQQPT